MRNKQASTVISETKTRKRKKTVSIRARYLTFGRTRFRSLPATHKHLYFDGETIYSYGSHFPIACHVTDKHGKPAILFTTRSYSVTTSGHVSAVRSAIPKDIPVFNVYNPALSPRESLACYVSAVKENAESTAKGRWKQRATKTYNGLCL